MCRSISTIWTHSVGKNQIIVTTNCHFYSHIYSRKCNCLTYVTYQNTNFRVESRAVPTLTVYLLQPKAVQVKTSLKLSLKDATSNQIRLMCNTAVTATSYSSTVYCNTEVSSDQHNKDKNVHKTTT